MPLRIYRCTLILTVFGTMSLSLMFVVKPTIAQKSSDIEVPKEIVRQLTKVEKLKESIRVKPDGSAENLSAKLINLNRDSNFEIEVQGKGDLCGANNCDTWIYRKTRSGYEMLLATESIELIKLQKTFTNGYRDIMASTHGSAFDHELTLYKFDGKKYQRVGCFFETYRYLDNHGKWRESKRPRVSRIKCEPY